jgi:hypothetical protein
MGHLVPQRRQLTEERRVPGRQDLGLDKYVDVPAPLTLWSPSEPNDGVYELPLNLRPRSQDGCFR